MPKRTRPKPLTPAERKRTRRNVAVMAATSAATMVAVCLLVWLAAGRKTNPEREHPHPPVAYGGTLVSLGKGDRHFHVEAVVGRRGAVTLYILGSDATTVQEVESQVLDATARPEGVGESMRITLLPVPQAGDASGMTSRFAAKLPRSLRGRAVALAIPKIAVVGQPYPVELTLPVGGGEDAAAEDEEERTLYLTPGGKYTEADVRANGDVTPSTKYQGFQADHDTRPRRGDRICPVTRTKANAGCSWVVSGQSYQFCCPACVEEFVRGAKERPGEFRDAGDFVAK